MTIDKAKELKSGDVLRFEFYDKTHCYDIVTGMKKGVLLFEEDASGSVIWNFEELDDHVLVSSIFQGEV